MDAIPQDVLVEEILCRVPPKFWLRCKLVSKEWLNLISAAKYSTTWCLAFKKGDGSMIFRRLDEQGRLTADDSVLLSNPEGFSIPNIRSWGRYFLDNPVTESVLIRELRILANYYTAGLGLAFDGDDIDASRTKKWKLVAILHKRFTRSLIVSVYDPNKGVWSETSSKSDHWFSYDSDPEAVPSPRNLRFNLGDQSSIYNDGALHWVWKSCLITFSFKPSWRFRIFKLPDVVNAHKNKGLFWRSEGGRLCYCHVCLEQGLCIWVFDKSKKGITGNYWSQAYSVSMGDLKFPEEVPFDTIYPYAVNEERQLIYLNVNESLARFDNAEKTIEPVEIPPECAADGLQLWSQRPFVLRCHQNNPENQEISMSLN